MWQNKACLMGLLKFLVNEGEIAKEYVRVFKVSRKSWKMIFQCNDSPNHVEIVRFQPKGSLWL